MLKKLILISVFTITLLAQPTLTEVKDAIQANPELLNTAQAQRLMQKKGISKENILDTSSINISLSLWLE